MFYDPFTQAIQQQSMRGVPTSRQARPRAVRYGAAVMPPSLTGSQVFPGSMSTGSGFTAAATAVAESSLAQAQQLNLGAPGKDTVYGQQQQTPAAGTQTAGTGSGGSTTMIAAGALLAAKLLHFF